MFDSVMAIIQVSNQEKIPQKFYEYDDNTGEVIKLYKDIGEKFTLFEFMRYHSFSVKDTVLVYYYTSEEDEDQKLLTISDFISETDEAINIYTDTQTIRQMLTNWFSISENRKYAESIRPYKNFFDNIQMSDFQNQGVLSSLKQSKIVKDFKFYNEYILDSMDMFNLMSVSESVAMIKYISESNETYIKIRKDIDKDQIPETDDNINHIYVNLNNGAEITFSLDTDRVQIKYVSQTQMDSIMEFLEGYTLTDETVKSIEGQFDISIRNYTETNFYFFLMISVHNLLQQEEFREPEEEPTFPPQENMIYIQEISRPRSLKKNMKYYFRNLERLYELSHSVSFTLENITGNEYRVFYTTKTKTIKYVEKFAIALQKYMIYFGEKSYLTTDPKKKFGEYMISNFYNTPYKEEEKTKKITVNKITNLKERSGDPDMFPSEGGIYAKYMCECKQQPIIIDSEDVQDWEAYGRVKFGTNFSRTVLQFPPNWTNRIYYVCPSDEYKHVVLKPNKSVKYAKKYPYLPCCKKEDDRKGTLALALKDYEEAITQNRGPKIEAKEGEVKNIVLPSSVKNYVEIKFSQKVDIKRLIVKKENSLFAAMMKASGLESVTDKNVIEIRKSDFVENTHLECTRQETFGYTIQDLKSILRNNQATDSKLFIRFFEELYRVNIIILCFEEDNAYVEIPRHKNYHIRNINPDRKTVLIFKDKDRYSLISGDSTTFDTSKVLDMVQPYYSVNFDNGIQKKINEYRGIVWEKILRDHQIVSQRINKEGRAYCLNVMFGESVVSMYIPPSPPVNAPTNNTIYHISKKDIEEIMGPGEMGRDGLWYSMNRQQNVFVVCQEASGTKICKNMIIDYNSSVKNDKYKQHRFRYHNSKVFVELMTWAWTCSRQEVDQWISNYTSESENDFNNVIFRMNSVILPKANSTEEAFGYIKRENAGYEALFLDNKLQANKKIIENLRLFLKKKEKLFSGKLMVLKSIDENVVKTKELLFDDMDLFEKWKNKKSLELQVRTEMVSDVKQYIYLSRTNNMFLIVTGKSKTKLISLSEYWKANRSLSSIVPMSSSSYNIVESEQIEMYRQTSDVLIKFSNDQYGTYIKL